MEAHGYTLHADTLPTGDGLSMIQIKINFSEIKARVSAAESLQESNQDDDCKRILRQLAEDILNRVNKPI